MRQEIFECLPSRFQSVIQRIQVSIANLIIDSKSNFKSDADKKDADHLDKVNTKQISNRERSSADSTNRQSQSSRERKDSSTSTSNKVNS